MRSRLLHAQVDPPFFTTCGVRREQFISTLSGNAQVGCLFPLPRMGMVGGFVPSEGHSLKVLMNLTSSSPVGHQRPLLEGTSCSWTGGTQLYPQLSELPSWIVPTRTTTELVRLCYTHLSIRTPLQGIAYIILSNEKHSVTVLCRGN